ncbi:MAG: DUF4340 domain-containing protein [Planctomycetota bacterium]
MNDSQKTGIFWAIAAVSTAVAALLAAPSISTSENSTDEFVNQALFPEFKDPLTAASLRVVVFDEALGELRNFEVRRDKKTGSWTIPSQGGYPADALDQMRDAANLMVDLKTLDAPTDNIEDHAGMGVLEPKIDDLQLGDEGVGRLVTFKDENQEVLASLIIGDQVPGTENQLYVRKPGQDLVYAVQLDATPLSTKFIDWIEEDLLQLSSIDLDELEIKDYSVALDLQGVQYRRNYSANLKKDATTWELVSLKEYDANPLSPGTEVEVGDKKLNTQKLNEIGNALDDLKFVNVLRKPDGISADLRADKDFTEDDKAAGQLIGQGFFPVKLGPDGERELLSENGELAATTKEGVTYILRFGKVSGLSDEEDSDDGSAGGVNRYLMVSTTVDETRFPVPDLQPIPQTLEDLDALDNPAPPPGIEPPPELNPPLKEDDMAVDPEKASKDEGETPTEEMTEEAPIKADETPTEKVDAKTEPPTEANKETPAESADESPKDESTAEPEASEPESTESGSTESGETEASGEGESNTVGGAQEEEAAPQKDDQEKSDEETAGDKVEESAEPAAEEESTDTPQTPEPKDPGTSEEMPVEEVEETEEEKLERLAGAQEKITKENERKLDERKDKIEAAKRRSRELNDRFADWYYVIPEETYTKLRISREDLFDSGDAAGAGPSLPGMPPGMTPPGMVPPFQPRR